MEAASPGRRVAIVCRLDEAAGEAVAGFIDRLGLEAFEVRPRADGDDNAIDRLDGVRGADYAIVMVPAGDLGGSPGAISPEVLLEVGFLFGAVGRRRLCFLIAGATPTLGAELDAVVTRHSMDDAGLWRLLLAREMRQAGLDVDMNRAL
jgi:hypothetical protein